MGFKDLSAFPVRERTYIGDGVTPTIGSVVGGYRTITGGTLDGCALHDPESKHTVTTTAGYVLPECTGVPTSPHYSVISSSLMLTNGGALVFPGLIGDGSYIEVTELECVTDAAASTVRLFIGGYSPRVSNDHPYGIAAGMEFQPFTTDYYTISQRIEGSLYVHTAVTDTGGKKPTFRIEFALSGAIPGALTMTHFVNGVQAGVAFLSSLPANAQLCIGMAGSIDQWKVGTISTGTVG